MYTRAIYTSEIEHKHKNEEIPEVTELGEVYSRPVVHARRTFIASLQKPCYFASRTSEISLHKVSS